jgi:hypothetical protein
VRRVFQLLHFIFIKLTIFFTKISSLSSKLSVKFEKFAQFDFFKIIHNFPNNMFLAALACGRSQNCLHLHQLCRNYASRPRLTVDYKQALIKKLGKFKDIRKEWKSSRHWWFLFQLWTATFGLGLLFLLLFRTYDWQLLFLKNQCWCQYWPFWIRIQIHWTNFIQIQFRFGSRTLLKKVIHCWKKWWDKILI